MATKPKTTKAKAPKSTKAKTAPKSNFQPDGKFAPGHSVSSAPKRPKRVTATEVLDVAADHLADEFTGTRAAAVFVRGFSPIKEIMRMYGLECNKQRPSFERKIHLLKSLLPYIYPTMKSVEFEMDGDLPTLTLVLSDDDDPEDQGKGKKKRGGNKIQTKTK